MDEFMRKRRKYSGRTFLHLHPMDELMRKRRKRNSGRTESSLAKASKSPTTLPEPPTSEEPSSPIQTCHLGMDGHLGAAAMLFPPLSTRSPLVAFLTQYSTANIYRRPPKHSYDICFCLPLSPNDKNEPKLARWYTIKIFSDGPGKVYPEPLIPFWKGKLPGLCGFAALGSRIYCFGGYNHGCKKEEAIRDVYQLQVTPNVAKDPKWVPVSPMISRRIFPCASVLGSKIFVCNSPFFLDQIDSTNAVWGEVFDPVNGKWEAVPKPPMTGDEILSATLENPDRILVAIREPDDQFSVVLYLYTVQQRTWKELGTRRMNDAFDESWGTSTVIVGNFLYWVQRSDVMRLFAYDLYSDIWLNGPLVLGHNFFDENFDFSGGRVPHFLHLEKQRFCFLKRAVDDGLHCVIVDVSPMPEKKTLGISVVWEQKYAIGPTRRPTFITDCVVLPK